MLRGESPGNSLCQMKNRNEIFVDGRSELRECAFRLLFRGFNFRGLPINRELAINRGLHTIIACCL